jgi:hypothetical protein
MIGVDNVLGDCEMMALQHHYCGTPHASLPLLSLIRHRSYLFFSKADEEEGEEGEAGEVGIDVGFDVGESPTSGIVPVFIYQQEVQGLIQ